MEDEGALPGLELLVRAVEAVGTLLTTPGERAQWDAVEATLRRDVQARRTPLGALVEGLGLTSFDVQVLVCLVGVQLAPSIAEALRRGDPALALARHPTVGQVVVALCPDLRDRALARRHFLHGAALRKHRLVNLSSPAGQLGGALSDREVALDESVLRYLLNERELAESLTPFARFIEAGHDLLDVILPPEWVGQARELVVRHDRVRQVLARWDIERVVPEGRGVVFLFSGPSGTGKTLLARALATHAERRLLAVSTSDLPERGVERALRTLFTEARMCGAIVLFEDCEQLFGRDAPHRSVGLAALDEANDCVVVLTTNEPSALTPALERRILLHIPFDAPGAAARRQIWELHLPEKVPLGGDVDLDVLADQYELTGGQIKNAVLVAVNHAVVDAPKSDSPPLAMPHLVAGCRSQLRHALEALTTRAPTSLTLRDVVLPDTARAQIEELLDAIRDQPAIMNAWGFRDRLVTGAGITALFDGDPGTGKTLCAEVVGATFGQPIHRVNLASVVSKWIGETEKHLVRIFSAARASRAMLLFDEADALFASRTEQSVSATDRYANMEVNLLLQEIERFPGVVILTTNFYGRLDKALLRRIMFRVTFERPDAAQQEQIWRTLCPAALPLGPEVDFAVLTRSFDLTGGRIKNALLRAAYQARAAGTPVTMALLHAACASEYKAEGRVTRDPEAAARDRVRDVERRKQLAGTEAEELRR